MTPTLEPGDWVVATAGGRIAVGDVVVIEHPERRGLEVVKRVSDAPAAEGDEWFVRGDNPATSTDSRTFGAVGRSAIKGRVRLVYSPLSRWRVVSSRAWVGTHPCSSCSSSFS